MSGRSSTRRRSQRGQLSRRLLIVTVVLLVTAGVVYAGVRGLSGDEPDDSSRSPSASSATSPSSTVDLSKLPIGRGEFCDRLDEADVEAALGGPVSDTAHYGSGDRVALAPGVTDVSHEFNCTFDASTGSQARVWVFAEPVTTTVARSIVRDARADPACAVRPNAPTFGTPSVGTVCRTSGPASRSVTLRGLFGDAWLSCLVSTPGASSATETARRADQWCVRVATTLGARP